MGGRYLHSAWGCSLQKASNDFQRTREGTQIFLAGWRNQKHNVVGLLWNAHIRLRSEKGQEDLVTILRMEKVETPKYSDLVGHG